MAEGRADAKPAPGRKARYRFEYQRNWPLGAIPTGLGLLAAGVLGALAVVNASGPPKAQLGRMAAAARKAEEPAVALMAFRPVPAERKAPPSAAPERAPSAKTAAVAPPPTPSGAVETGPAAAPSPAAAATAPPAAPPSPSPGEARLTALASSFAKASETGPAPPAPAKADPCAAIRILVERLVCADPTVRTLDQRVEEAYRNALALTDNRRKVEREQARWLARRAAVGPGRTAVLAYYEERYKELWPVPMRVGPRLPPIVRPPAER